MAKAKDSIDLFNDETAALRELNTQYQRLSMTAVVDDDYPEMKFNYDSAVQEFVEAVTAYRPILKTISVDDSISRIAAVSLLRCNRWHPNGINSWSMSDWAVAFAGEVGELCNVVKKINRVRDGMPGNKESSNELRSMLVAEVADCYLYLDLFAQAADINLYEAIRDKFNAVSARLNFPERL